MKESHKILWRIPICIVLGVAINVIVFSLGLSQGLSLIIVVSAVIATCLALLFIESRIVKHFDLKVGTKVLIVSKDSSFHDMTGVLEEKTPYWSALPYKVKIDNYMHPTLFARDELQEIKE